MVCSGCTEKAMQTFSIVDTGGLAEGSERDACLDERAAVMSHSDKAVKNMISINSFITKGDCVAMKMGKT